MPLCSRLDFDKKLRKMVREFLNKSKDWDDAPEMTQEILDQSDWYNGDKLIRRGKSKIK